MWGGQGGIPRLAAAPHMGMMPVVSVSAPAPLVPAAVPLGPGLTASPGPSGAAWRQDRHHQPPVQYHEHRVQQQQGYPPQYINPQAGERYM